MAQRYTSSPRAADTSALSDVAALRRQLAEIKRNMEKNISENNRLSEIQKLCNALQNDSKENLSITARKVLHAEEHLDHVTQRTKEIDEIIQALNDAQSVDACFLMDCTNSMRKFVDEVKERIFETVRLLKVRFPNLKIRLAFVGYRDLNLPKDRQYSVLDFTDEEEFHEFVSLVQCEYGGDYCEDVLGGLQQITKLKWKQPVRIMIHVGDAPSHGQRYHDLLESADYYYTHDNDGSIGYSYVQEMIELKVKYFFGRLTSHTNKMIEQFRKYAENKMSIEEIDLKDFQNLLPFIVESVSQSISEATSSLMKNYSINGNDPSNAEHTPITNNHRNIVFDDKQPIWSNIKLKNARVIKYECTDQLQCTENVQSWNIKIAEKPFAEGSMRIAYYGLMQYKERWETVAFKEYKRIGHGANTKDKYLQILDCQTVAAHLAAKFNSLSQLINLSKFVKKS